MTQRSYDDTRTLEIIPTNELGRPIVPSNEELASLAEYTPEAASEQYFIRQGILGAA
jgi:hypothetical protein